MISLQIALLCCLKLLCFSLLTDYYELLGITREADTREIRQAFKKLALTLHPDKHQGDPEANERFVKINKAYEVLKNEETRKKYDTYGEEGLKEDFGSGWKGNFHSWNYYHESFGIYDDDPEVVTLSKNDFEQFVADSEEIWFVNYYSPQCSHCHQLAPAWRQLARDLEEVVHIGAVNCEEDWALCRQENIRSYPSLMLYPKREPYKGSRDSDSLLEFLLSELEDPSFQLTQQNFAENIGNDPNSGHIWFIQMCTSETDDCWDNEAIKLLAISLKGLVKVGHMSCPAEEEKGSVCQLLGSSGRILFKGLHASASYKEKAVVAEEERKEVISTCLQYLPHPKELWDQDLKDIRVALSEKDPSEIQPCLVLFLESKESQAHLPLEVKRLPALLSGNLQLAHLICTQSSSSYCSRLFLKKFPVYVLFKQAGAYEIHHGQLSARSVSSFVRQSLPSYVETLGPKDFPGRVVHSGEPWFIDFFAPWCPPCMRFLPEWRKASRSIGHLVHFGTVDCTAHSGLCTSYNVNSYPTTILFNHSEPHTFRGSHSAQDVVEFAEDTLLPPLVTLTPALFTSLVEAKTKEEIWVVDFYAPWCTPCQQLAPHFRRMAKALSSEANIHVGQVDCQAHQELCRRNGVRSYPTIRTYPMGNIGTNKLKDFSGWSRDANSLKQWVQSFLPTVAQTLSSNEFFNKVLISPDPWMIDFYAPWCGHCQHFAPTFEELAKRFENRVMFGKVNCDRQTTACQQANIQGYPTLKFYEGSTDGKTQGPWGEELHTQNSENIADWLELHIPAEKKMPKDEL